jgi:hypothetical protein
MLEVTDPQKLALLRSIANNAIPIFNVELTYRLHRVWEVSEPWYYVEIVDSVMRVYKGMLNANTGHTYLDTFSIMSLVQQRIDIAIQQYNSHSWPYRGV